MTVRSSGETSPAESSDAPRGYRYISVRLRIPMSTDLALGSISRRLRDAVMPALKDRFRETDKVFIEIDSDNITGMPPAAPGALHFDHLRTHGDATNPFDCGRPLNYVPRSGSRPIGPDDYAPWCPVHGALEALEDGTGVVHTRTVGQPTC